VRPAAEALAAHLAEARITAIYVTQYQRTGLTAAPTAAKLRITPVKLHSDAIDELVQKMRTDHPSDVVLYVGHNNSVGKIAKAYGHPEAFVIDHTEYDNLFILVPRPGQPPTLLRLKY
jgi:phosphohistidine phosphatase SixA